MKRILLALGFLLTIVQYAELAASRDGCHWYSSGASCKCSKTGSSGSCGVKTSDMEMHCICD